MNSLKYFNSKVRLFYKFYRAHRQTGILWLLLPALILASCTTSPKYESDPDNAGLILPEGFHALVVADSVGRARHIVVDDQGVIYVSLDDNRGNFGIAVLKDHDGDGRTEDINYFGTGVKGTGIELYHHYLYFGTDTSIIRFALDQKGDPAEQFETVVKGYPLEYQHASKTFTFDNDGNLYVNVGAPSNACAEQDRQPESAGMDPCPILETFGGIWRYDANILQQVHLLNGSRFATGIRNAVAIQWNFHANHLYIVQHGRDQLYPLYKEHYAEVDGVNLPAEEFFMVNEGDNFGWPYCYYDPFKNKKVLAPEYGGDGEMTGKCEGMKDPIMAFPAHYAPNDLLFYEGEQFPEKYRHGAFIAFHGSWNRAPQMQKGYNVVFVPFKDSLPSSPYEVFADNFAGIDPVPSPGDAQHRPCGLAMGPDGSLYVADSKFGRIYRIFYQK
jgi:glucose/arabinose dehydrogenase